MPSTYRYHAQEPEGTPTLQSPTEYPYFEAEEFRGFIRKWKDNDPNGTWDPRSCGCVHRPPGV